MMNTVTSIQHCRAYVSQSHHLVKEVVLGGYSITLYQVPRTTMVVESNIQADGNVAD